MDPISRHAIADFALVFAFVYTFLCPFLFWSPYVVFEFSLLEFLTLSCCDTQNNAVKYKNLHVGTESALGISGQISQRKGNSLGGLFVGWEGRGICLLSIVGNSSGRRGRCCLVNTRRRRRRRRLFGLRKWQIWNFEFLKSRMTRLRQHIDNRPNPSHPV